MPTLGSGLNTAARRPITITTATAPIRISLRKRSILGWANTRIKNGVKYVCGEVQSDVSSSSYDNHQLNNGQILIENCIEQQPPQSLPRKYSFRNHSASRQIAKLHGDHTQHRKQGRIQRMAHDGTI